MDKVRKNARKLIASFGRGEEIDPYNLLFAASIHKNHIAMRAALDLGANANAKIHGNSALAIVCCDIHPFAGKTEDKNNDRLKNCARLLISRGARLDDLQSVDGTSVPILTTCASRGQTDLVLMLLDAGASPNVTHSFGRGSGHGAVWGGRIEMLSLLISKGLDIHRFDGEFQNLAMLAASYGRLECLQVLATAGARLGETNREGQSALSLGLESTVPEVAAWALAKTLKNELESGLLPAGEKTACKIRI